MTTFVKGVLLLHLSYFCQAQVSPTNSSGTTDGNLTQLEEKVNYNPCIQPVSGKCHWTLKLPEKPSSGEVLLDAALEEKLVPQICKELGCGGVYDMNKIKNPSNSSCFSDCVYEEGQLQNCSLKEATDCVVISEAVCGMVLLIIKHFIVWIMLN